MNENKFKPAWWLSNPHLQTIWGMVRRSPDILLKRERFELPDGDFVDLDWCGEGDGPIVLILHGFEGSIDSHYAKGMLKAMTAQGFRGVFMHFRGCSGEPNRLAREYHSGDTKDVNCLVDALRKREPHTVLAAIGYSLGGNVLLKWLGETGVDNPLSAAVAISVPLELKKSAIRIGSGFSRVYQRHLLKSVKGRLKIKFQVHPPEFDAPALSSLNTLKEFDHYITAPMHGFASGDEYYRLSSSRAYLGAIRVPTLLITAKDDPFLTEDMLPSKEELSEYVHLEVTKKGGHVGFVNGAFPWKPHYWLEERIPVFLKSVL